MKLATIISLLVIPLLSCGPTLPKIKDTSKSKTELVVTFDNKEVHRRGGAWISQQDLRDVLLSKTKKVIIFGAPWCKPCVQLQKVVKKAELKPPVHFINLNEAWAFEMSQDLGVKDIPLMLYIDEKGDPIAMRKGGNKIALYLLVNL